MWNMSCSNWATFIQDLCVTPEVPAPSQLVIFRSGVYTPWKKTLNRCTVIVKEAAVKSLYYGVISMWYCRNLVLFPNYNLCLTLGLPLEVVNYLQTKCYNVSNKWLLYIHLLELLKRSIRLFLFLVIRISMFQRNFTVCFEFSQLSKAQFHYLFLFTQTTW